MSSIPTFLQFYFLPSILFTFTTLPPPRPLRLRKPLTLLPLLYLELIQQHLFRNLLRPTRLQLLDNLKPPLILRKRHHITTTSRIKHPLPNLRARRTRGNEDDTHIRVVVSVEGVAGFFGIDGGGEGGGCSGSARYES